MDIGCTFLLGEASSSELEVPVWLPLSQPPQVADLGVGPTGGQSWERNQKRPRTFPLHLCLVETSLLSTETKRRSFSWNSSCVHLVPCSGICADSKARKREETKEAWGRIIRPWATCHYFFSESSCCGCCRGSGYEWQWSCSHHPPWIRNPHFTLEDVSGLIFKIGGLNVCPL